jgi:hypothetical protein
MSSRGAPLVPRGSSHLVALAWLGRALSEDVDTRLPRRGVRETESDGVNRT